MWLDDAKKVEVFTGVDRRRFEAEIVPRHRPAVLKGLVGGWPAVTAGKTGPDALCDYLKGFANDNKVQFWSIKAEDAGRYSFNDELTGPNHTQRQLPFRQIADLLLRDKDDATAPCHYAGGVPIQFVLPGLERDNQTGLIDVTPETVVSLWIGNRTRTAAHWDLPQNLACVVAGRRRFTTFSIDQVPNLYVGPLDMTLAGQPTSLVDFYNPDFERFPRFREAMQHAEVADLEPGDVLYMPSLTVHHVESLEGFGAMINYWWQTTPAWMTTPLTSLFHARLTLRDRPEHERMAWRALFDHYIFGTGPDPMAHIPKGAHGLFGPMTPEVERSIRAYLIQTLGGR